jgi:Flp pilus assembly protein TadG
LFEAFMVSPVWRRLGEFRANTSGNFSLPFVLAIVPVLAGLGMAVDYGRAILLSSALQSAVDRGALTATNIQGGATEKKSEADRIVLASLQILPQTMMTVSADGAVSYTATVEMPTLFSTFVTPSMTVTRAATVRLGGVNIARESATPGWAERVDTSCIFVLNTDLQVTLAANVEGAAGAANLSGCGLRSNRSVSCSGSGVPVQTSAVGSVTGCPYPQPGEVTYPDLYAGLADNIGIQCGMSPADVTWTASGMSPSSNVSVISRTGYREIHICGNLILAGSGSLSGESPHEDTVIIIRNGSLRLDANAVVSARRTTFVIAAPLTSTATVAPIVDLGENGSLSISAGASDDNPWKSVALYQSPAATGSINMIWKAATRLELDGIAYFPNARLDMRGTMTAGALKCSKLVAGEIEITGSANLQQSSEGCSALKLRQSYLVPIAGTPSTGTAAYLYR